TTHTEPPPASLVTARQELHHRRRERVVPIARDHVSRIRDVDVPGVRREREEVARVLLGHDVAHAAADEERRHAEAASGPIEPLGVATRADASLAGHQPWVPVPAVAPVRTEAQVLPEAGHVLRPRAVRDVGRRGQRRRRAAPRAAGLSAAVQQQHRGCGGVAVGVGHQLEPAADAEGEAARASHESRCTVSGEKAGTQTAMYSAPSGPGELYSTHSPRRAITASPAETSIVPPVCLTRSMPASTTVYSSN